MPDFDRSLNDPLTQTHTHTCAAAYMKVVKSFFHQEIAANEGMVWARDECPGWDRTVVRFGAVYLMGNAVDFLPVSLQRGNTEL